MSLLTTLQQLRASERHHAQPLSRLRYLHVADQPMLILPLNRPGETARPLAVMAGCDPGHPRLFLAPPGDDDRFLTDLAEHLHTYIHSFHYATRIRPAKGEQPERREYLDAPQLVVTGTASAYYLKMLGRALRYRPVPEGTDPATSVSHLGCWLTFFAERAEYATSSLLLNLTGLLSTHWATGQSTLDNAHLAPLMAWIFPPPASPDIRRHWPPKTPCSTLPTAPPSTHPSNQPGSPACSPPSNPPGASADSTTSPGCRRPQRTTCNPPGTWPGRQSPHCAACRPSAALRPAGTPTSAGSPPTATTCRRMALPSPSTTTSSPPLYAWPSWNTPRPPSPPPARWKTTSSWPNAVPLARRSEERSPTPNPTAPSHPRAPDSGRNDGP